MIIVDNHNLSSILGKVSGIKLCSGLEGKKCFRQRRNKGWLCIECHRKYMKEFMRKKKNNRIGVDADGYNFSQENYI